jgi:hypothetical protein
MKKFIRNNRLVLGCANFLGGVFRLVAVLVDMAFNYRGMLDAKVVKKISN